LRTTAKSLDFHILPTHPLTNCGSPDIYEYDEGFRRMDWALIETRKYHNQDCKLACMAECLALDRVDPKYFHTIEVKDNKTKDYVIERAKSILGSYSFYINARPEYFGLQR
jgi:hypothetical protein